MIGLYAIVAGNAPALTGARGERLRALPCAAMYLLAGDAPPPLTAESLRAHEAAVRRIAEAVSACLPARFGAAAADDDALLRAAEPRRAELLQALELVRGREQMTVRVHGPSAPSPLPPPPTGTRYLEERRRARKLPELDPLRAALEALVRAERIERHFEPGLLASVYHLIDRGASAEYQRAAQSASLDGLRLRVSGPWPAWSFAPELGLS